jgi:hypothetical protein
VSWAVYDLRPERPEIHVVPEPSGYQQDFDRHEVRRMVKDAWDKGRRRPAHADGLREALELMGRCEKAMNLTAAWLKNAPEAEHEVRRLQIAAGALNRFAALTREPK